MRFTQWRRSLRARWAEFSDGSGVVLRCQVSVDAAFVDSVLDGLRSERFAARVVMASPGGPTVIEVSDGHLLHVLGPGRHRFNAHIPLPDANEVVRVAGRHARSLRRRVLATVQRSAQDANPSFHGIVGQRRIATLVGIGALRRPDGSLVASHLALARTEVPKELECGAQRAWRSYDARSRRATSDGGSSSRRAPWGCRPPFSCSG